MDGILEGYNEHSRCSAEDGFVPMTPMEILLINLDGDLFDLMAAYPESSAPSIAAAKAEGSKGASAVDSALSKEFYASLRHHHWSLEESGAGTGVTLLQKQQPTPELRCSALFKVLEDGTDVFFGHDTWYVLNVGDYSLMDLFVPASDDLLPALHEPPPADLPSAPFFIPGTRTQRRLPAPSRPFGSPFVGQGASRGTWTLSRRPRALWHQLTTTTFSAPPRASRCAPGGRGSPALNYPCENSFTSNCPLTLLRPLPCLSCAHPCCSRWAR